EAGASALEVRSAGGGGYVSGAFGRWRHIRRVVEYVEDPGGGGLGPRQVGDLLPKGGGGGDEDLEVGDERRQQADGDVFVKAERPGVTGDREVAAGVQHDRQSQAEDEGGRGDADGVD